MAYAVGIAEQSTEGEGEVEIRLELIEGRFCVLMQLPSIGAEELVSFRRGATACSFLDPGLTVPIALWTFAFEAPLSLAETNFDLRIAGPPAEVRVPSVAALERDGFLFLLYRGQTLVETCVGRPSRSALRRFAATLRRQREADYGQEEFRRALRGVEAFTVEEIFVLGRQAEKRRGNNAELPVPDGLWYGAQKFLERTFGQGGGKK